MTNDFVPILTYTTNGCVTDGEQPGKWILFPSNQHPRP